MHLKVYILPAVAILQLVPGVLSLNLGNIKNFYVTGASLDWYGAPPQDYSNTANGPNHIEYLSYNRNWNIRKYAFPGAVTNPNIVPGAAFGGFPVPTSNWDAQIQYVKQFFSGDQNPPTSANGANSLFVITASNTGNDILNSWNKTQANTATARTNTINALVSKLVGGFNDVYALGGRNFIFFAVVPVHKIPDIQAFGPSAVSTVQSYVQQYNAALKSAVTSLQQSHSDANIYLPDFTQTFLDAVSGSLQTGPTAGYVYRTTWCQGVVDNSLGEANPRNPNYNSCPGGNRARQFLFRDDIHFSSPLHCEYAYQTLRVVASSSAAYPANCQYAAGTN